MGKLIKINERDCTKENRARVEAEYNALMSELGVMARFVSMDFIYNELGKRVPFKRRTLQRYINGR